MQKLAVLLQYLAIVIFIGQTFSSSVTNINGLIYSGYIQEQLSNYTSVYGCWSVQQALNSPTSRYSAQWIGLGGTGSGYLIQTGTESNFTGSPQYEAVYDVVPNTGSTQSLFAVNQGDKICASIRLNQTTRVWNITIIDTTNSTNANAIDIKGGIPTNSTFISGAETSADWIEERPEIGNSKTALTNFINAFFLIAHFLQTFPPNSDQ